MSKWSTTDSPACFMGSISSMSRGCDRLLFCSQEPWFVRGRSIVGHMRRDGDGGEDEKEWRFSTSSSFPSLPHLPRARRSPTHSPRWCLKRETGKTDLRTYIHKFYARKWNRGNVWKVTRKRKSWTMDNPWLNLAKLLRSRAASRTSPLFSLLA